LDKPLLLAYYLLPIANFVTELLCVGLQERRINPISIHASDLDCWGTKLAVNYRLFQVDVVVLRQLKDEGSTAVR